MSVRALGSRLQLALPRLEELHAQAAPALPPERLRLMLAPRPISRARWPSAAPLFEDRLEPREGEAAIELLPRLGSIQALGAAASSLPAPIRDALGARLSKAAGLLVVLEELDALSHALRAAPLRRLG